MSFLLRKLENLPQYDTLPLQLHKGRSLERLFPQNLYDDDGPMISNPLYITLVSNGPSVWRSLLAGLNTHKDCAAYHILLGADSAVSST